jgi:hypothetical protein
MSYSFDVLERAWASHIRPKLAGVDERLLLRFETLLRNLHDANHDAGDIINKNPRISKLAHALETELHRVDSGG